MPLLVIVAHRGSMVFAGAIEFSTGEIALILSILAAIALGLAAVGALIAWSISRQRIAIPLGAIAIYAGGWFGMYIGRGNLAPLGVVAAIGVGIALRPSGGPAPQTGRARQDQRS